MSGRHQPLNGADSPAGLQTLDVERLAVALYDTRMLDSLDYDSPEACRELAGAVADEYARLTEAQR